MNVLIDFLKAAQGAIKLDRKEDAHNYIQTVIDEQQGKALVPDVFDTVIGPKILKWVTPENELLVRRIWDSVRVAMLKEAT